jgi:DNA-binding HxlR family transcriptional regulator
VRDRFDLIDVITGYQGAAAVTAAWRLGIVEHLAIQPMTSAQLAGRIDVDARSLDALLGALEPLGIVRRVDDRYEPTPFAREHLRAGAELGLVIEKEAVFAEAWLALASVVRTGRPAFGPWAERLASEPARARAFLEALDVLARLTGPDVVSLPELQTSGTILDVGGGLGTYTRRLVQAGRRVALLELPVVAAWAEATLADLPADRCRVVAADVLIDGIPPPVHGATAALVSHVLHDLRPDACVRLLGAVREALAPGASVVVNDFARDADRGTFGPFFDVMMRVETGGSSYRVAELLGFLAAAGFTAPRRLDAPPPLTLVAASNP